MAQAISNRTVKAVLAAGGWPVIVASCTETQDLAERSCPHVWSRAARRKGLQWCSEAADARVAPLHRRPAATRPSRELR